MKQPLRVSTTGLAGSVLLGRYRVVRELAKGGMGVVYLARAEGAVGFVKPVVIKLLLPEHTQDDRFVRMFAREARILSQLRHPSLVDVLEFGEQDGAYVLVLEYVRGYHIGLWLRFLTMKRRDAPPDVLMQITIDVLEALHHAHTQLHPDGSSMQIVHRDVSPSNILLDENGRARLLDFGVARMRGGSHDYRTQVKGFMGKLPYTAPEVFAGGEASPCSDLYACAVVLHEALCGQNVFRAETQAGTLQKVLYHVPPAIEGTRTDVPVGLDQVLAKALAKAEDARYADAREFAAALRNLLDKQESELRAQLSDLLKEDFGSEMSELFNLESLAHRDDAWRRFSHTPPRREGHAPRENKSSPATEEARAAAPAAPAPIGATIADSPGARKPSRQTSRASLPPPPLTETAATNTNAQPTAAAGEPAPTSLAPQAATSLPPTAAVPTSTSQRGLWIALCVVGGLALGAIAISLRGPPLATALPIPAPISSGIAQPAKPSAAATHSSPTPNKPVAAVTAVTTPVEAPGLAHTSSTVTGPKPSSEERPKRSPNPAALTRALRKQQPKLQECFVKHSSSFEGAPTTQLEFDLDASGKLTRVELSPRLLASTALGQCLLQIARRTAFPAQPRAVSFVIPITARSSTGG